MLNHTEKDCPYVSEEEKEKGYDWGMDIRAFPTKGFSKYKEEVSGLKLRKNLFVTKLMTENTTGRAQSTSCLSGELIAHDANNANGLGITICGYYC